MRGLEEYQQQGIEGGDGRETDRNRAGESELRKESTEEASSITVCVVGVFDGGLAAQNFE